MEGGSPVLVIMGDDSCWSWVQIPAPYTVWTFGHFFTLICSKNCIVCMKRPIINKKVAGVGPFKKQTNGKKL